MNGSIYNGASGLLSFQKSIDIESNNVANVNTIGFKSDSVSFNDLMYQGGIGKGVHQNDALKNFSQGSLKQSNSNYDFAIAGEGFFTLQDPANPAKSFYSRTGQFSSNNENYLTSNNGYLVLGMQPAVTGDIITSGFENNISSTIIDTDRSTYTLNTYANNYSRSAKEIESVLNNITAIEAVNNGTATAEQQNIIDSNPSLVINYQKYNTEVTALQNTQSGNNYKDVNSILNDISEIITSYKNAVKTFSINPIDGVSAAKAQREITFPLTTNSNGEYTMEVLINGIKVQQSFDTSIENTMNMFSDKISKFSGITSSVNTATGLLSVNSLISNDTLVVSNAKINDNTVSIESTVEGTGSGKALMDALYSDLTQTLSKIGGSVVSNKSEIMDVANATSPALSPIILDLNTLGMSSTLYEKVLSSDSDSLASYPSIQSEDGNIYLSDGDARFLIGKLVPVTFTNPGDLNPQGDNIYLQGVNQEDPIYLANTATIMDKYLENSNIDLSETLVNLIVWQKAFDANSKSVTTSDELLKTALALKNK